ncbi:hypothetical protein [Nocardioides ungokensis]|nr:hypothetical protein [Nocardioides ungokensis]
MTEPASETGGARRGRPGHDQETVLRRAVELFNRRVRRHQHGRPGP